MSYGSQSTGFLLHRDYRNPRCPPLLVIAFQSPANIGHHKRIRHTSGMGFEEMSEGLDQRLVAIGCLSSFEEGGWTHHAFWRQLGFDHRLCVWGVIRSGGREKCPSECQSGDDAKRLPLEKRRRSK
jgi:hypothetical protein